MRKKLLFSGILISLLIFAFTNMILIAESATTGVDHDYICTDLTAPDIFLNLTHFNSLGIIEGSFYDEESLIEESSMWQTIKINDVYLPSYNFTYEANNLLRFKFNVNNWFDTTPGVHNNISMVVYNFNDFSPSPSLKQGAGAGGGGGFGFCDTSDCWGMPSRSSDSQQKDIEINSEFILDNTAPIINVSLVNFKCCWNVSVGTPYDPDQIDIYDVAWAIDTMSYLNTTIVEAMNVDYITNRIIVSWDNSTTNYYGGTNYIRLVSEDPCPCTPCPYCDSDFALAGGIIGICALAIVLVRIKQKRK